MRGPSLIPHSSGNASSFQVVGRQLHEDLVARHDADEVHPHLAADVREHRVPVLELDLEHRVWKGFGNGPLHFDDFFVARLARQLRSRHRLTRGICQREPKVYQDRPLLVKTHQAATASPSPGTVRTTLTPCARTTSSNAAPMSPIRPPTWALAIPMRRASSVTRMRRSASGDTFPTGSVIAASACHPSIIAPASMPTMSPSRSFRFGEGMPWTISSLIEVQIVRGNPGGTSRLIGCP